MKYFFVLLALCGSSIAFAQKATKPEAFAKSITAADLKKHLYIIASREMEGRETATEGQRKAAAYIENHFKALGLQPVNGSYQQIFNVYQDSLLDAQLEVNGKQFEIDKDFNANLGTNITASLRFSEIVAINPAILDTLKSIDLNGRLVMIVGNILTNVQLNTLRSKGVAAILAVSTAYPRTTPAPRKAQPTLYAFKKAIAPQQYFISGAVAAAMIPDFEAAKSNTSLGKVYNADILLQTNKTSKTLQSSNVIGMLEGSDLKDQYLVITAHYDHLGKRDTTIYYGADDDGSGTVGVLELAEAFTKAKAAGKGPRRSIVFMTVSGEEKGLWGSDYYSTHPLLPLSQTTANLNIDMIGRIDPKRKVGDSTNYVYVVGDDKLSSDLRVISEAANKQYTKLELDYKYNDPNDKEFIYYRSDHYNFAKNGVPIIFYFNGTHADYHRPTDTPDKINYNLMAKRAQLVFYTAWEMANRDQMLKRDLPLPELRR